MLVDNLERDFYVGGCAGAVLLGGCVGVDSLLMDAVQSISYLK